MTNQSPGSSALISAAASSFFDAATKQRGRNYFREDAVSIESQSSRHVVAAVFGSSERPYSVHVSCTNGAASLDFSCSCPQYARGIECKHIWATLLECDAQDIFLEALSNGNRLIDDDEEDYDHVAEQGEAQATVNHASQSAWRQQLGILGTHVSYGSHGERPLQPNEGKPRRISYVIEVSESARAGRLRVQLYIQEMKKNGEFGKSRIAKLHRSQVDTLADQQDREVLPFLFDKLVDFETTYGYYRNDWQTLSSCLLNVGSGELLLPKIARTGRLSWLLDADLPPEEANPVTWDADGAWTFRAVIREDNDAQAWHVDGELCRGQTVRPLQEAVLVMPDGIVLFPDTLAICELGDESQWISAIRQHAPISIPYSDRTQFLTSLATWPQPPNMQLPPSLLPDQQVGTPRGRMLVLKPEWRNESSLYADVGVTYSDSEDSHAQAEMMVKFGDHKPGWYDPENDRTLIRDRAQETRILEQLEASGVWQGVRTSHQRGDVSFPRVEFSKIVSRLVDQNWIIESQGNVIRTAGNFSLSVKTDIDWFELHASADFDGNQVTLPTLLAALKSGEQFIRLDDGSTGMLPEAWLKKFGSLTTLAETKDDTVRFAPSQALLLDVLLAEQDQVKVDSGFSRVRDRLRSFDGVKGRNEPRGFHGELREYQRIGLGWMQFLRDFRFGGCLADDMGLGKTIQVLAMLQARRFGKKSERRPSLVVVPKSLVFNWIDEAANFTPNLKVLNYTGLGRKQHLDDLQDWDLVVTTYGTLRRDIVDLKSIEFDYAILDESQAIKNHNSQAAKACRLLQSRSRLAMTGTPIENHLGELWSLFEFLNPGMLGRTTSFTSLAKSASSTDDDTIKALAQAIQPFVLRRTKQQVLTELPEKTEQTLLCELSSEQRKGYNEIRDFYRQQLAGKVESVGLAKSKIHVLEALLRLRQAACHPGLIDDTKRAQGSAKVDALLEQLDEILAEGHKALVFSQFTSLLSIVRDHLDQKQVTYEYLDGRTRKRADRVKRFQEDPNCSLFLISLKAGGSGLNLTAADYVFILDPWWNPAVEAQAIDRTHRIGQTRRVFAYRLIAQDTVEEKILELQKSKRQLADALITADDSVIRNLTTEDLQLLLS